MEACKRRISAKTYFAHPAVSRSSLFEMRKSPAHYKYALESPEQSTPSLEFGTAFHTAILEPKKFWQNYRVMPSIDRRTKEGKIAYQELLASKKIFLSAEDYKAIEAMQASVLSNKYARVLLQGEVEKSYFWTDEFTGIDCKCRADCRTDLKSTSVIVDLKSCSSAETDAFMRDCFRFGYDLQSAYYKTGVEAVTGKPHKFVFIAVEKTPPYAVNILEADEIFIKKGYDDMRLYLGMLKECRETGNYYGYTGKDGTPNMLGLPAWLAKDYE